MNMASSTIKNMVTTSNNTQTNVTVSPTTWTNIGSVTLSKGKYIIIGIVSMSKMGSSGEVTITLNDTSTPAQGPARYDNFTGIIPTGNGGGIQMLKLYDITTDNKTVYMHAYHTGSSDVPMYPAISVVKLL